MRDPRPYAVRPLLAAGAALLLSLAACGEDESGPQEADHVGQAVTATEASGEDRSSSSSQSQSIEGSGSTIRQSSSGSSQSSIQSQSSADGGITMLSGTGRTQVEELSISQPSRLSWTNTEGEPFMLRGDDQVPSISSRDGRGEVELDAGDYAGIEVRGDLWTVVVRPR